MSPRPRRAAAQAAAVSLAANVDGDAADDEGGGAWGGKGRRTARGAGADPGDDKENVENADDDSEDDVAAPTRRSGRARRPANRLRDSDEDEDDDRGADENDNFVRRSSRAAKPVARLSPEWKQHVSDDDDEPEAEETDPEGEYVEEDDDEESTEEEEEESDEEIEGIPTRYSRRQRATVERYSPKPNERGLAGGGGDRRAGRRTPSPTGRSRGRKPKGKRRSRPDYRESPGDSAGRRGTNGKRWMDDTDDSDADAGHAGNPGNFPALFGGMFGGGRAPDMYPLAPPGGGGGGGAVEAGGPGGKKDAADAEITPLTVDPTLTFEQVGGLSHYVHSLKEMVFLPLLYPEVFARFKMNPPRGVLLYGAPGTGKTLLARALAASCSRAGAEVSFYMRKGADVLSKWVGESERQLRLLFAEAQKRQPAIIFFDEIDGLAPVRSSKTDQIHNSIVATLLALMDGLDSRGRVVVLGATNRVDAIDGALRRPGRFDRELAFPLPNAAARFEILKIHTRAWEKPPPSLLLEQLAARCVGYCGADLKALCTEAAVHALRRRYPQIYESDDKLLIDPGQILPGRVDFRAAMEAITPASHRSAQAHARPLGPLRQPLMGPALGKAVEATFLAFPPAAMAANADKNAAGSSGSSGSSKPPTASMVFDLDDLDDDDDDGLELLEELDGGGAGGFEGGAGKTSAVSNERGVSDRDGLSGASAAAALATAALEFLNCPLARQPRLLLHGPCGSGQAPLAAALLHELEAFPVHAVGLPSLLADGGRSPEEALVGAVTEARRAAPAVLFLPHLRLWWDSATPTLRATLRTLMEDVPADTPLLLLATCDCERSELDPEAAGLFGEGQRMRIDAPDGRALAGYFEPIVAAAVRAARGMDARDRDVAAGVDPDTRGRRHRRTLETLPKAPMPGPEGDDAGDGGGGGGGGGAGDAATAAMIAEEDHALRQQRMFLRDLVTRLLYRKQWRDFASPVDDDQLPGYSKKVKEPMDLSTLLWKVDSGAYATMDAFLKDVHLIVAAAKTYWGGLEQERREANDEELDENGFDVVEGRKVVSRAHALEDTIQELAGQLDPSLVQRCAAIARHRAARASGGGGGDGTGEGLPLMPGEGDRGERRSRRGADGELAEQEGGGDKRKRIHDEPGYVPDPEALARDLRAKRAKEEAAKKEAAEKAAAAQEAAAAAAAAVTQAAEAAAKAAAGANQSNPRERAMSADGSAPMQFLDAIDPLTDAEVATNSASVVDFLVTRCSGKPAADAEALATDLGRAVKTALSRDALRTTDWTRHLQGALQSFMSARTA